MRLYSRPGNDLTPRFSLIVEALARLRSRSCIIDSEAVACDDSGIAQFNRIRYRRYDGSVFLYAFDLIELNGDDLRRDPLEVRKATLALVVAKAGAGIRFNEHLDHDDGEVVFRHALPARAGRHRQQAQGLVLPLGSFIRLAQDEKPGLCGGAPRGEGGLGTMTWTSGPDAAARIKRNPASYQDAGLPCATMRSQVWQP
jgi:hypothetical protein